MKGTGAAKGTCWKEDAARSGASAGKRKGRLLAIGKGAMTCYLERNRGSRGTGGQQLSPCILQAGR